MALKTVKVSPVAHERLMERSRALSKPAGVVLLDLLEDDSVKVPLEPVQRERWEAAAAECGVSLPQFILLTVEGLLNGARNPATSRPPALPTVWGACCRSDAGTPEPTP